MSSHPASLFAGASFEAHVKASGPRYGQAQTTAPIPFSQTVHGCFSPADSDCQSCFRSPTGTKNLGLERKQYQAVFWTPSNLAFYGFIVIQPPIIKTILCLFLSCHWQRVKDMCVFLFNLHSILSIAEGIVFLWEMSKLKLSEITEFSFVLTSQILCEFPLFLHSLSSCIRNY